VRFSEIRDLIFGLRGDFLSTGLAEQWTGEEVWKSTQPSSDFAKLRQCGESVVVRHSDGNFRSDHKPLAAVPRITGTSRSG
jgi:hypothetical protein